MNVARRIVELIKLLEDLRLFFRRNPAARVGDADATEHRFVLRERDTSTLMLPAAVYLIALSSRLRTMRADGDGVPIRRTGPTL